MVSHTIIYALAAWAVLPHCAMGGQGASTFACLSLDSVPSPGFNVSFNSGEKSSCMNAFGHGAIMAVTQPGITCTCIGYVEAKGSGGCWFKMISSWSLSYLYASDNKAYHGETSSHWYASHTLDNGMTLHDESAGTMVCSKPELCNKRNSDGPTILWNSGTAGPIYVSLGLRS
ncbi:MAG: hypothetical protein OHK93_004315 [Ramalina farinacea]|uniref:Uncharacterized protein n=1 Tax=Ramalina farinacea TaxID=258253 RepID=A0AA43QKS2_9LECA|nr:hypothetical protein [Ramalina farinacea]